MVESTLVICVTSAHKEHGLMLSKVIVLSGEQSSFFCDLTFLKPVHPRFVGMAPEGTITTDGRESPGG